MSNELFLKYFYCEENANGRKSANGKNGKIGAFLEPMTLISERPFFRQFEL